MVQARSCQELEVEIKDQKERIRKAKAEKVVDTDLLEFNYDTLKTLEFDFKQQQIREAQEAQEAQRFLSKMNPTPDSTESRALEEHEKRSSISMARALLNNGIEGFFLYKLCSCDEIRTIIIAIKTRFKNCFKNQSEFLPDKETAIALKVYLDKFPENVGKVVEIFLANFKQLVNDYVWVTEEADDPLSFDTCCYNLGKDPNVIRERLLKAFEVKDTQFLLEAYQKVMNMSSYITFLQEEEEEICQNSQSGF